MRYNRPRNESPTYFLVVKHKGFISNYYFHSWTPMQDMKRQETIMQSIHGKSNAWLDCTIAGVIQD